MVEEDDEKHNVIRSGIRKEQPIFLSFLYHLRVHYEVMIGYIIRFLERISPHKTFLWTMFSQPEWKSRLEVNSRLNVRPTVYNSCTILVERKKERTLKHSQRPLKLSSSHNRGSII